MYFCSQEQSRAQRRVAAALQRIVTAEAAPLLQHSRADLLVHRLLELLVVEDGPHLAVAVARPERRAHLDLGLTNVVPAPRYETSLSLWFQPRHQTPGGWFIKS